MIFDSKISAGTLPTLFNFFVPTFPQSDNLLANFYADDFTVSCSNSNVDQMNEVYPFLLQNPPSPFSSPICAI